MVGIEYILLGISILILISVIVTKAMNNLGVPTLLIFLAVGMLAGSDGPGGIEFSDAALAQAIGCIALMLILFSGGLDTQWQVVRPVALHAASLATLGVLLTAVIVAVFVSMLLGFSAKESLLLGAIISSTDAAAVFSVLRSKKVFLKEPLKPLLELESGSNDPMAVFLTISMIELIVSEKTAAADIVLQFFLQMGIGGVLGLVLGKLMVWIVNHLRLPHEGIYFVFALAYAAFVYSATAMAGGSGFLAVYIAGIMVGSSNFVQKKSLLRFFDGLAWLSQIGMFLTLGLLVFPSQLQHIVVPSILISAVLMLIARPVSVFISLAFTRYSFKEKLFVSWVGLRGAAPIILATFPLLADIPNANMMFFNTVFFIVLTSALLQGWSIGHVARILGVQAPEEKRLRAPIESVPLPDADTELVDLNVPHKSAVAGKTIIDLSLPSGSLIALIGRNDQFIVPSGSSVLEEGDTLLVLVRRSDLPDVKRILSTLAEPETSLPS